MRRVPDDQHPRVLALSETRQFQGDISAADLGVPAAELGEHTLQVL